MTGAVVLILVGLVALARIAGGAQGWFSWRRYARQRASLPWGATGRWRTAQVEADRRGGG